MSGPSDQDLLARLNALKPSNIDLERTQASPVMPTTEDGDDIARRFLRLRSRPDSEPGQGAQAEISQAEHDANEVEDIDAMLKEFRSNEKASLAPGDDKRVQILLAQAQNAFMNDEDENEDKKHLSQQTRAGDGTEESDPEKDRSESTHDDEKDHSSEDEDAEADELLAQILAEVRLNVERAEAEPEHPSQDDAETQDEDGKQNEPVDEALFPSTPSKDPELATPSEAPLQLPSAPTTVPTKAKPKSALKRYTDEEIDTWCEICQANAQVKCLGCDGELYCIRCWKEGHTGQDAGYEMRQHRCVQYSKPGPEAAAA